MVKRQHLERLRRTSIAQYLSTPYFRQLGTEAKEIAFLVEKLNAPTPALETVVKPLLLASFSEEIQSISENMMQPISDQEAVKRANKSIDKLLQETDVPITNRDRFPHTDWLEEPQLIGSLGQSMVYLLGQEQGSEEQIVAVTNNPEPQELTAQSLFELMSHAQEPINLSGVGDSSLAGELN